MTEPLFYLGGSYTPTEPHRLAFVDLRAFTPSHGLVAELEVISGNASTDGLTYEHTLCRLTRDQLFVLMAKCNELMETV